MRNKQIIFTEPNKAELLENQLADVPAEEDVRVRMVYTAVSAGTERANLIGECNISGERKGCNTLFPRKLGYCGVGIVDAVGSRVKDISVGQRVIVYFGKHSQYNVVHRDHVIPVVPEDVDDLDAALMVIAGFPAEGIRKSRLEYGESCMIVGAGILGLIAVALAKIAGAVPVIAADPNPARRELALKMGADVALDSLDENYVGKVKEITGGSGANVVVEASGNSSALKSALLCCAPMARVTLLGCTRTPDVYDLYHDVHYPGVSLIGAHNFARPKYESMPGNWTAADDYRAMLKLIHYGRLDLRPLISEIHSPEDAPEVYRRLAFDKDFPIGVLFDWRKLGK
ncbi:MAG: zinc-binding dehydrogenase [Eubacteriales bacterium]